MEPTQRLGQRYTREVILRPARPGDASQAALTRSLATNTSPLRNCGSQAVGRTPSDHTRLPSNTSCAKRFAWLVVVAVGFEPPEGQHPHALSRSATRRPPTFAQPVHLHKRLSAHSGEQRPGTNATRTAAKPDCSPPVHISRRAGLRTRNVAVQKRCSHRGRALEHSTARVWARGTTRPGPFDPRASASKGSVEAVFAGRSPRCLTPVYSIRFTHCHTRQGDGNRANPIPIVVGG